MVIAWHGVTAHTTPIASPMVWQQRTSCHQTPSSLRKALLRCQLLAEPWAASVPVTGDTALSPPRLESLVQGAGAYMSSGDSVAARPSWLCCETTAKRTVRLDKRRGLLSSSHRVPRAMAGFW